MDRGGSTCDAYECIVQRRRVFVKRLKAEYRDNPLYRAAFDKEYDLGVSLSHPSLPRYVGFGGDYIVMDFIEGDTLADLIKRDDPRLKNRKFVRRLLLELVDVVDYLHHRNIVHCDIKADNVIISPYDDRPATLIDLDKAYTSWLDSTHGNTQKYGCDGCADGAIDFRGIGKIASQLGQEKVARVCEMDDVSVESIRQALSHGSRTALYLSASAMLILGLALSLWHFKGGDNDTEPSVGMKSTIAELVVLPDTLVAEVTEGSTLAQVSDAPAEKRAESHVATSGIDYSWIASLITSKTSGFQADRDRIYNLINSDTTTKATVDKAIGSYAEMTNKTRYAIFDTTDARFPEVSMQEVRDAIARTKEYDKWVKTDKALFDRYMAYSDSIERIYTIDAEWAGELIASKANVLQADLDRIYRMLESDTVSHGLVFNEYVAFSGKFWDITRSIYKEAKEHYPHIRESDIQFQIDGNREWVKWSKKESALFRAVRDYGQKHSNK
ncbi:MAG: protein kinase [Bacteroides sp.]|nr:protein kinase [Bacteroides sp.]